MCEYQTYEHNIMGAHPYVEEVDNLGLVLLLSSVLWYSEKLYFACYSIKSANTIHKYNHVKHKRYGVQNIVLGIVKHQFPG